MAALYYMARQPTYVFLCSQQHVCSLWAVVLELVRACVLAVESEIGVYGQAEITYIVNKSVELCGD